MIDLSSANAIGLSPDRLRAACRFLQDAVRDGRIPGVAMLVGRHGVPVMPFCDGRLRLDAEGSPPIAPDTIFLIASVTKPIVVTGAMLLVERGKIALDDPVCSVVPEFATRGKEPVTVRHLMTHTSGLPDMLPEDRALRRRHAPLQEFIRRIYDLELAFPPGTNIQYQSCGIAMLGEIIERVEGVSLGEFLRRELFGPLGMDDTSLGARDAFLDRVAEVNVDEEMRGVDWGWNTPYWQRFAAPWGGMFSTVGDLCRFCRMFLDGGRYEDVRIMSEATVREMTTNQTERMTEIPLRIRRAQAWGLGWCIELSSEFGEGVSAGAFGHWGATGTLVWADPARELICVLLTTATATAFDLLRRCSGLVAASVT